jgi:hypothetical protein
MARHRSSQCVLFLLHISPLHSACPSLNDDETRVSTYSPLLCHPAVSEQKKNSKLIRATLLDTQVFLRLHDNAGAIAESGLCSLSSFITSWVPRAIVRSPRQQPLPIPAVSNPGYVEYRQLTFAFLPLRYLYHPICWLDRLCRHRYRKRHHYPGCCYDPCRRYHSCCRYHPGCWCHYYSWDHPSTRCWYDRLKPQYHLHHLHQDQWSCSSPDRWWTRWTRRCRRCRLGIKADIEITRRKG